MMRLYIAVTGGRDLREFWELSPAELFAWAEARSGAGVPDYSELDIGEEVEE